MTVTVPWSANGRVGWSDPLTGLTGPDEVWPLKSDGFTCVPRSMAVHLRGGGEGGRDALEGKGPQRRAQKRLGRRLEEVAKAVGGGYGRLHLPLKPSLAVRETVAGHRLGALEGGGGGGYPPPSNACLGGGGGVDHAPWGRQRRHYRFCPHQCFITADPAPKPGFQPPAAAFETPSYHFKCKSPAPPPTRRPHSPSRPSPVQRATPKKADLLRD